MLSWCSITLLKSIEWSFENNLSNSSLKLNLDFGSQEYFLSPGKRKLSRTGLRIKNTTAPEDYKDIAQDLNTPENRIAYLGFYLFDLEICHEFSSIDANEDNSGLSLITDEDRLHLVPSFSLPLENFSKERWGQDQIDNQASILDDDADIEFDN